MLMTIPLGASGLNFQVGLGFGRATRAFYSEKFLKIAFRTGLGPRFFSRATKSMPTPAQ
jgi:hypothetical protein